VTTIWFWNRSVLVTDRLWKNDARPRGGHRLEDGRTRRPTESSFTVRLSVSREGHGWLAVAVRLCSGAEEHGRWTSQVATPGQYHWMSKDLKADPASQG